MNYCEKIHYTILSTKRAEFGRYGGRSIVSIASKRGDHEVGFSVLRGTKYEIRGTPGFLRRRSVGIMGIMNRL